MISKEFLETINTNKEFINFKKIIITKKINMTQNDIEFVSLDRILKGIYEW